MRKRKVDAAVRDDAAALNYEIRVKALKDESDATAREAAARQKLLEDTLYQLAIIERLEREGWRAVAGTETLVSQRPNSAIASTPALSNFPRGLSQESPEVIISTVTDRIISGDALIYLTARLNDVRVRLINSKVPRLFHSPSFSPS